jgi:hypothetical protein
VFKDPAMSLHEGKSVIAGHGAILIGIESAAFFDHLKELVEHEEPELAPDICVISTAGFSPAMKVRVKGEANASQSIADFLGCEEYGARDAVGQRIGWSVRRLTELAEMIRAELQTGETAEEIRKVMLQRNLKLLSECWAVIRDIALSETDLLFFTVPQPLSPLLNLLRHHTEQHLNALQDCKQHQQAKEALEAVFEFLLSGDVAERDVGGELLPVNIQHFQTFVDRAMVTIGTMDGLLTDDEKAFFKRAATDASEHAARLKKKNAEIRARIDALPHGKSGASAASSAQTEPPKPQPAAAPTKQDTAPSADAKSTTDKAAGGSKVAAASAPPAAAEWRRVCGRLSLDDNGGRVMLDGVVHDFEGKTTQQFMLLALLSKRANHWHTLETLEGSNGPWSSGDCTVHALGSCATKVRQALRGKGMEVLASAVKTRKFKGDPQAKLVWPPTSGAVG